MNLEISSLSTSKQLSTSFSPRLVCVMCYNGIRKYRHLDHCEITDFRHETNTKLHNWAKKFLKSYKDQLVYLDLCGDCYENSVNIDDWFITVCSNKHRVVWAHYRNHPPWPAKVLREEKNFITVQFFGEHTLGKLKRDKVFDYSQKNPNELSDTVKSKKMKECLPVRKFSFSIDFKTVIEVIFSLFFYLNRR